MTVGEVHNMFLPMPTANMLVRYSEHKTQIDELLDKLPVMFQHTGVNESALGAALNAAALMLVSTVHSSADPCLTRCRTTLAARCSCCRLADQCSALAQSNRAKI